MSIYRLDQNAVLYIDLTQNAVLYIALAANFVQLSLLDLLTTITSFEEPTNLDQHRQHVGLKALGVEGTKVVAVFKLEDLKVVLY